METKLYGEYTRKRIYDYIQSYINEHGYAPSQIEISKDLHISEPNVGKQMHKMIEKGMLITDIRERLLPRAVVPHIK